MLWLPTCTVELLTRKTSDGDLKRTDRENIIHNFYGCVTINGNKQRLTD